MGGARRRLKLRQGELAHPWRGRPWRDRMGGSRRRLELRQHELADRLRRRHDERGPAVGTLARLSRLRCVALQNVSLWTLKLKNHKDS
jgi:hypothetical protein